MLRQKACPIKKALQNTIQNVNFVDLTQTRKACEANSEARYIKIKYSVWINPLHFKWNKFIQKLEKHFPDILDKILNYDNQRSTSTNGEFTTSFRCSHTKTIKQYISATKK